MSRALERARERDGQAFRELIAPYSRELHLHCYRILGSLVDAEDLLQETLTAAWSGLNGFEGSSSVRTWLYSIATNRCLNAIRDSKRRPPAEPVPPYEPPAPSRRGDITWLQLYPDAWIEELADGAPGPAARYEAGETVTLAFITAVQKLPARQAAALILCDVLGFSGAEAAVMLGTSATSIKGLLQRARTSLAEHGEASAGRSSTGHGSAQERQLARRFADALRTDDIDRILELLTNDAWLTMPPAPHEYHGREAIGRFLRASAVGRGPRVLRLMPTRANHQPAFGCFFASADGLTVRPTGILLLTVSGDRIGNITRFLDGELLRSFGLGGGVDASRR